MLDYLSQFPCYSKQEAIQYVKTHLHAEIQRYALSENDVSALVSEEYDLIGPKGSQAAWICFTGPRLIGNIKRKIELMKTVVVTQPDQVLDVGKLC